MANTKQTAGNFNFRTFQSLSPVLLSLKVHARL